MSYVILLYGEGKNQHLGTCFFSGDIYDAYEYGDKLLDKHSEAYYFDVFEADFYFNVLKYGKSSKHNNQRSEETVNINLKI